MQFTTSSTYRRVPNFSTPSFCRLLVEALRAVRSKLDFLLAGWVLMSGSAPIIPFATHNPVRRGLVASPGDWPLPSWRFYNLGDRSILEMDRIG